MTHAATDPLRHTGRTARMMESAWSVAMGGGEAIVIFSTEQEAMNWDAWLRRKQETPKGRVVTCGVYAAINRTLGTSALVFVDHATNLPVKVKEHLMSLRNQPVVS